MNNLIELLKTEIKFLAFFNVKPDLKRLGTLYLVFGIFFSWIAGMGRYWDNPRAELWQYWGLGSLAYIFILALILWLLTLPLKPQNWSYKNVLIFVGMTSPMGVLYAIPVERYYSMETAQTMNVWFLAVVATWRVVLWFLYLKRAALLRGFALIVATLLPLVIIVSSLTYLNLEHVVFRVMAGLGEDERSGNDGAYIILALITYLSVMASPVLLISYIVLVYRKYSQRYIG